jgi:hypothetical protein
MAYRDWLSEARGAVMSVVRRRMLRHDGTLRSSRRLPERMKASLANSYAAEDRAEIALAVAGMYPGGDYFEFGSESFRTFMNFLTAFDLNGLTTKLPETKFYAFDVFGDLDQGRGLSDSERWYFERYRGDQHYREAEHRLRRHNLLLDRCVQVKGYFEDTLTESLCAELRRQGRSIGFAFLDCNISSSYKTCFGFVEQLIRTDRAFIYMDEYFLTLDVPQMFEQLCARLHARHGLRARYVRNAGTFGALFCLMHEDAVPEMLPLAPGST